MNSNYNIGASRYPGLAKFFKCYRVSSFNCIKFNSYKKLALKITDQKIFLNESFKDIE